MKTLTKLFNNPMFWWIAAGIAIIIFVIARQKNTTNVNISESSDGIPVVPPGATPPWV